MNPRVRRRSRTASVDRLIGEYTGLVSDVKFDHPPREEEAVFGADLSTASLGRVIDPDGETDPDPEAGGKGRTVSECVQTAVGEFVERYCAFWPSSVHDFGTVEATYEELAAGEASVPDFESIVSYDPDAAREFGEEPFDRTTEVEWAAGTNMLDGRKVYVPTPLVSLGATTDEAYLFSSSSGLACGPDLASALLGAIYEYVERDAVMRSWYQQNSPTMLSLEEWPNLERERRRFGNAFGEYRLCRFETDGEFHTLGAVYVDDRDRAPKFLLAASAHLDFEAAARDALVEAGQGLRSLKTLLAYGGGRDTESPNVLNLEDNFEYYALPENFEEVSVYFEGDRETVPRSDGREFEDARTEWDACLDALDAVGATPVAFDLTTPGVRDAGLRVARLYVPELVTLCPPALPPANHPALADADLTDRGHPFP